MVSCLVLLSHVLAQSRNFIVVTMPMPLSVAPMRPEYFKAVGDVVRFAENVTDANGFEIEYQRSPIPTYFDSGHGMKSTKGPDNTSHSNKANTFPSYVNSNNWIRSLCTGPWIVCFPPLPRSTFRVTMWEALAWTWCPTNPSPFVNNQQDIGSPGEGKRP